jgi:hypothetical protein
MLFLSHVLGWSNVRHLSRAAEGEGDMQAVRADELQGNGARTWQVPVEPEKEIRHQDYDLVLVEWHDAWFDSEQAGPEDCRPDYLVRTVGFLVGEGPTFLSIAHEVLPEDDGFRAVTHIPLAIVEGVTRLFASGA